MFQVYQDRRIVTIFCFGILSGMPWVLIGSMLYIWLNELGISRTTIGFSGWISLVFTVNFLWSPLIDHIRPKLAFLRGRQAWIGICQAIIFLGSLAVYLLSPGNNELSVILGLCLCIAIAAATQDIAIDAYRVDAFEDSEKEKILAAASTTTVGWYTGFAGLGAIPGYLSDMGWSWPTLYLLFGLLSVLIYFIAISFSQEKTFVTEGGINLPYSSWFNQKIGQPLADFFIRHGIRFSLYLLFFIFAFKLGEAFLGKMSIQFYKEMGYSNTDISNVSKLITWITISISALFFSLVAQKLGTVRQLLVAGIAMACSNLMFIIIHQSGPTLPLYIATAIVDAITTTWATVSFVAFISRLCSHKFSAMQYALLASLGNSGKIVLAGFSGKLVDYLDGNWSIFFIITIVMVIPALTMLFFMRKDIERTLSE